MLAYMLVYLGVPLADAINIFIDPYESVAEWLSRKVGTEEIGVRSQMSVASRILNVRRRVFEFDPRSLNHNMDIK